MESLNSEDMHFYIDYAPFEEVHKALWNLSDHQPMTATEVFDTLELQGQPVQSRRTEILRRLYDIGLASQFKQGSQVLYILTSLGKKVRDLGSFDQDLYPDLMHFLHFSSWDGTPQARKFLWSYRRCSELAWKERRLLPRKEMAARIQNQMAEEFPNLDYTARVGARFDDTAAGRWAHWVRALHPPPFAGDEGILQKRAVTHHELVLLALDDLYRSRGYRYGDPVILDELTLDEVTRVFFLDLVCCRELLDLAVRLTKIIRFSDTFAGPSVTLMEPYTVESI